MIPPYFSHSDPAMVEWFVQMGKNAKTNKCTFFPFSHNLKVQTERKGILTMPNYPNNPRSYGGRSMNSRYCAPNSRNYSAESWASPEMHCGRNDVLEGLPLAMAYIPWQMWRAVYDAEKALHQGTIFEELNKPFCGKGGRRR